MRTLILLSAFIFSWTLSHAQFNYHFSARMEPYQPLTGGTDFDAGQLWDEDVFKLPIGFDFILDGYLIDSFVSVSASFIGHDSTANISGFGAITADLCDRGMISGIASSPRSYMVTGTPGSRICKIEVANAGLYDEINTYNTADDYINFQIWLYEGSNAVELRYGSSKISHPTEYFIFTSDPIAAFLRFSNYAEYIDDMYYLYNNPANPAIDSAFDEYTDIMLVPHGLNTMPAEGTVYRFEPLTTGVAETDNIMNAVAIYPTVCVTMLTISNNTGGNMLYSICSIDGRTIRKPATIQSKKQVVDLSDLKPGMYFVNLENKKEKKTVKFFKQ